MDWISPVLQLKKHTVLQATIHPDIKWTLLAMSKRTGMTVSQISAEVLYTGLIEMQELDAQGQVIEGGKRLFSILNSEISSE